MSSHPSDFEASTYEELISVLESLPLLVRETRRRHKISVRAAGEATGVSAPTINRFELGIHGDRGLSLAATIKLLRWIGEVPR